MNIQKVSYSNHIPGTIEYHYAAFLTESGEVLLMGPFLRIGEAQHAAETVMKGKKSSLSIFPALIPGIGFLAWEREWYPEELADMAKKGN